MAKFLTSFRRVILNLSKSWSYTPSAFSSSSALAAASAAPLVRKASVMSVPLMPLSQTLAMPRSSKALAVSSMLMPASSWPARNAAVVSDAVAKVRKSMVFSPLATMAALYSRALRSW